MRLPPLLWAEPRIRCHAHFDSPHRRRGIKLVGRCRLQVGRFQRRLRRTKLDQHLVVEQEQLEHCQHECTGRFAARRIVDRHIAIDRRYARSARQRRRLSAGLFEHARLSGRQSVCRRGCASHGLSVSGLSGCQHGLPVCQHRLSICKLSGLGLLGATGRLSGGAADHVGPDLWRLSQRRGPSHDAGQHGSARLWRQQLERFVRFRRSDSDRLQRSCYRLPEHRLSFGQRRGPGNRRSQLRHVRLRLHRFRSRALECLGRKRLYGSGPERLLRFRRWFDDRRLDRGHNAVERFVVRQQFLRRQQQQRQHLWQREHAGRRHGSGQRKQLHRQRLRQQFKQLGIFRFEPGHIADRDEQQQSAHLGIWQRNKLRLADGEQLRLRRHAQQRGRPGFDFHWRQLVVGRQCGLNGSRDFGVAGFLHEFVRHSVEQLRGGFRFFDKRHFAGRRLPSGRNGRLQSERCEQPIATGQSDARQPDSHPVERLRPAADIELRRRQSAGRRKWFGIVRRQFQPLIPADWLTKIRKPKGFSPWAFFVPGRIFRARTSPILGHFGEICCRGGSNRPRHASIIGDAWKQGRRGTACWSSGFSLLRGALTRIININLKR